MTATVIVFVAVLSLLASFTFAADFQQQALNTTAGAWMYVFAYSWTPEFCYGQTTWPGCKQPQSFWTNHFTIHGLWPQYKDGTGYPSSCTTEAFNPNVPLSIGWSTMTKYWPNVQYAETDPNYDSFWQHEWSKHGTCSGLSQTTYFQDSINLIQKYGTPTSLINAVGKTISAATLRNDMGGAKYVSLQCTSGKYLNGAYSCWDQTGGAPTVPYACPPDVVKEDTCTADTLVVQSF